MTRVLHLIPGLTGGGAERQLVLIAPQQVALGHDVHIGFITTDVPDSLVTNAGIHLHRLATAGHHDPALAFRIAALIRSSRAEIVQTWILLMDVLGGAAALQARKPWTLSERSDANNYPPSLKTNARRVLGRRADAVIANSSGGVQYWLDQGVPRDRITEITNAVDVGAMHAAPDAIIPRECSGRPLVLFVGRLSAEKKPLVFVESMARVLSATNAIALVCGTGPMDKEMSEAIQRYDLGNRVFMLGHCDNVFGLLRKVNLCVAISAYEGSPNVVLEAIVAGCPLVVSNIPAYCQLLDDDRALFVPVGDEVNTARAIVQVLADPTAAHDRAERARVSARLHTPAAVAAAMDDVYRRTLCAKR